jgi:hypothetical protein
MATPAPSRLSPPVGKGSRLCHLVPLPRQADCLKPPYPVGLGQFRSPVASYVIIRHVYKHTERASWRINYLIFLLSARKHERKIEYDTQAH